MKTRLYRLTISLFMFTTFCSSWVHGEDFYIDDFNDYLKYVILIMQENKADFDSFLGEDEFNALVTKTKTTRLIPSTQVQSLTDNDGNTIDVEAILGRSIDDLFNIDGEEKMAINIPSLNIIIIDVEKWSTLNDEPEKKLQLIAQELFGLTQQKDARCSTFVETFTIGKLIRSINNSMGTDIRHFAKSRDEINRWTQLPPPASSPSWLTDFFIKRDNQRTDQINWDIKSNILRYRNDPRLIAFTKTTIDLLVALNQNEKLRALAISQKWFFEGSIIGLSSLLFSAKKIVPQGMAWYKEKGKLLISISLDDKLDEIYEINPADMISNRSFTMPDGAVHTSGLSWDGDYLWGVDYVSNMGYKIDLERSLATGRAVVEGKFHTGLQGTSACAIVKLRDETKWLAISDFMGTKKTIFIDPERAVTKGYIDPSSDIQLEYDNEGFSQGLEFINGFLFETENKAGGDVINVIDLNLLLRTRNAKASTVHQIIAPYNHVEDLAYDGEYLWTSDESSLNIYRTKLGSDLPISLFGNQ